MDSSFSIWPLVLGALIGIYLFAWPRYFKSKKESSPPFELTPNCLLTRLPVMLLTEPESDRGTKPHRFEMIYQMLKEHGYKVEWTQIPLEFQNSQQIKQQIEGLLEELQAEKLSFHFFISPEAFNVFNEVLVTNEPFLQVVTSSSSLDFSEPRLVLHRAVELAEQDFVGANPKQLV